VGGYTARVRALLLAVAVLLAAPGAAGAAPVPGDYGGGGFAGRNSQPTWMWARIGADGSARIGGRAHVGCALAHFDAEPRIAPDGSFRFSRVRTTREMGHVILADVTVSGRFDGAVATGRLRARARDRTPGGAVQRCAARRSWKLHLRPVAGAPAPPQPGGAYLGLTSQTVGVPKPFVLHVNRAATRVGIAIFDYTRVCRRGGIPLNNFTPGAPIRPDGTFALRDRFTLRFSGGVRERFRIDVDGRFAAGGVGGTLRATTVARRRGRVIDRCDTGQLSFAALL
jgi:hypothetical protein